MPSCELDTGLNTIVTPVPLEVNLTLLFDAGKHNVGMHVDRIVPSCTITAEATNEGVTEKVRVNDSPKYDSPLVVLEI